MNAKLCLSARQPESRICAKLLMSQLSSFLLEWIGTHLISKLVLCFEVMEIFHQKHGGVSWIQTVLT